MIDESIPKECPTCGTAVPEGAVRCVACGRVLGEIHRCPHCNAIAGLLAKGDGYVCAACSAPREYREGMVVLGGSGPSLGGLSANRATGAAGRAGSTFLRVLGAMSIGGCVIGAAAAALIFSGGGAIAAAIIVGGTGVGFGALLLRAGAKTSSATDKAVARRRELAIIALAEKSKGDLTVTEVAREMKISMAEADAALSAMTDGSRVDIEVDPNGVIHYIFRELGAERPPDLKVRIAALENAEVAEAEEPAAAEQRK